MGERRDGSRDSTCRPSNARAASTFAKSDATDYWRLAKQRREARETFGDKLSDWLGGGSGERGGKLGGNDRRE